MAENESPAPSGTGTGADAPDAPRPLVRRPHPVIKPSTETVSLQQIGGGGAQPLAGSSGPGPSPSSSTPEAVVLNAPSSPSLLADIGPLKAPSAPAAPPSSGTVNSNDGGLPVGNAGGLSSVGQAGAAPASPEAGNGTAPPALPEPPNLIHSGGHTGIDRRPPIRPAAAEEPGFDPQKAVKIGIGVVLAVLAVFVVLGVMPSKIAVPSKFTTYTSTTGTFALDAPEGWARKPDSLADGKPESDTDGVTISQGKGIIQVWTDSGSDAMKNQLLSGSPNLAGLLDDKHKEFLGILNKRVGGYKETDAGSFSLGPFGAKIMDYTGTSGFLFFKSKVHGYAATVQGPKHFMMILLQCPENNWDDMKPVYERILRSAALDGVSAKTIQERLGGGFGGAPAGGGGGRGIQIPGGGSVSIPPGVGGF